MSAARVSTAGTICSSILLALGILLSVYVSAMMDRRGNADIPLEQFPNEISGWIGKDGGDLELSSREKLRLDRYVRKHYSKEGNRSNFLYIGYWQHQTGEYQAAKHSPLMCLPANGWQVVRLGEKPYTLPDGTVVKVNRVIGTFDQHRSLFFYFFFAGEDFYTQEWQSLLRITMRALTGMRTDGGIIEVSVPISEEEKRTLETGGGAPKLEVFLLEFLQAYVNFMRSK